jgi:hypothetical protein
LDSEYERTKVRTATLPIPSAKESQSMTHAEAIQGLFLPDMNEEEEEKIYTQ